MKSTSQLLARISWAFRSAALAVAVALIMSACNKGAPSGESASANAERISVDTIPKVVLYVTLTLGNPFYQEMIEGLRAGLVSAPNWKLETMAGQKPEDASGQRDVMDAFLVRHKRHQIHLVGLVLVPANSRFELVPTLKAYNEEQVPIINLDIPIDSAVLAQSAVPIASFVGSNNREGGSRAADVMSTQLPRGGSVLVLMGASGSANARDRRDGFRERLRETGARAGVKYVLKEWTANWKMSEAVTGTDALLGGGNRLDGIFGENDLMALGAAQAISAHPSLVRRPTIVGYDAIPDARAAVQEGRIFATISQNPALMGKLAIEYLQKLSKGDSVPARQIIPVSPVTK
ncbi:substrate-binding domain-containing protein [soil metagenome]